MPCGASTLILCDQEQRNTQRQKGQRSRTTSSVGCWRRPRIAFKRLFSPALLHNKLSSSLRLRQRGAYGPTAMDTVRRKKNRIIDFSDDIPEIDGADCEYIFKTYFLWYLFAHPGRQRPVEFSRCSLPLSVRRGFLFVRQWT